MRTTSLGSTFSPLLPHSLFRLCALTLLFFLGVWIPGGLDLTAQETETSSEKDTSTDIDTSTDKVDAPKPSVQWNQFRGPNGSGSLAGSKPPLQPTTSNETWSKPLPPGLSSPVVWGDRLFLTGIEGERLVTLAIDKRSGDLLWKKKAPQVPLEKVHKTSSPAASTPCVDDTGVYVYFGSYGLLCYDHEGEQLWSRPIATPRSLYGNSTSPILYQGLLIQVLDNENNLPDSKLSQSKILAVYKATGKVAWEAERPFHRSGWSTPIIWSHRGAEGKADESQDELVVLGNGTARSYHPESGEEIWAVSGFSKETIALPVAGINRVYLSSAQLGGAPDETIDPGPFWKSLETFDTNKDGKIERKEMTGHFTFPLRPELPLGHPGYGIPLPDDPKEREKRRDGILRWVDKDNDGSWSKEEFEANLASRRSRPILAAVRPGGQGDITKSHVPWIVRRSIPEVPSPLWHDKRIYLVRNGGLISAVSTVQGKVLYRERLRGSGYYSASPVVANDHIYLVSDQGLISVVKAGDQFEIVHEHALKEMTFVTPALDENTIYYRTEKQLRAFRRK